MLLIHQGAFHTGIMASVLFMAAFNVGPFEDVEILSGGTRLLRTCAPDPDALQRGPQRTRTGQVRDRTWLT